MFARVCACVCVCVCSQIIYIDGSEPGQSTTAENKITNGHGISSPRKLTKENDLEEDWRVVGETNWMYTGKAPSGRG